MAPLDKICKYKNPGVIRRFCAKYQVNNEVAEEIFEETKKWLFLNRLAKNEAEAPFIFIDDSTAIIDEMWHNFILFTKDYQHFCDEYLGGYLHHQPSVEEQEPDLSDYEKLLFDMYSFVYAHLGRSTTKKWFDYYPKTYSPETIRQLRI